MRPRGSAAAHRPGAQHRVEIYGILRALHSLESLLVESVAQLGYCPGTRRPRGNVAACFLALAPCRLGGRMIQAQAATRGLRKSDAKPYNLTQNPTIHTC